MLEGCKCDKEKEKVGQSKQELVLWGGSGQQFKEFVRAVGRVSMDLKETGVIVQTPKGRDIQKEQQPLQSLRLEHGCHVPAIASTPRCRGLRERGRGQQGMGTDPVKP